MAKIPKHKLSGRFALNNETLIRKVKEDKRDTILVEVGDSKQPDFKPQFKVSRWGNEVNFSMRAEEHPAATVDVEGEVIKYKTPSYEVHQYEKPEAGEDGGFEFEWVLPAKPESNVLTATIQTKELDFFYQPKLTEAEIAEGAHRPDNVIGSYAVYHKSNKNNHYKTGKAFHIYRPEAIDAAGKRTWCELSIDVDTEILTVTVPKKFLKSATYPVVVDPTFGYTSVGGTNAALPSGRPVYPKIDATVAGTLSKATLYTNWNFSGSDNATRVGWYDKSGTDPNSKVEESASTPTTNSSTPVWNDYTLTSAFSADLYFLGIANSSGSIRFYYDTGSAGDNNTETASYTLPTTATVAGANNTRLYSIYATYYVPINGDISLASGTSGFDISLTSGGATSYDLTAATGSFTITGNAATLTVTRTITAGSGTFTLTGNNATLSKAYVIQANTGTYSLTGHSANITVTRKLVAATGTYTLTGNDATFSRVSVLVASSGSFSITGHDANFSRTYAITADSGTYTLTGNDATLSYTRKLVAAAGTFTLTGNDATLTKTSSYLLTADTGSFTITGNDATFTKVSVYNLTADTGSFTLTGNAAGLTVSRKITAATGTFTLTGQDVAFSRAYSMVAESGSFVITGYAASIIPPDSYYLLAESGTYTITGNAAELRYNRNVPPKKIIYDIKTGRLLLRLSDTIYMSL